MIAAGEDPAKGPRSKDISGARRGALAAQGGPRPGRPRPPTTEAQPLPEGSGAGAAKGAEADADRKAASAGPRTRGARSTEDRTAQRAKGPRRASAACRARSFPCRLGAAAAQQARPDEGPRPSRPRREAPRAKGRKARRPLAREGAPAARAAGERRSRGKGEAAAGGACPLAGGRSRDHADRSPQRRRGGFDPCRWPRAAARAARRPQPGEAAQARGAGRRHARTAPQRGAWQCARRIRGAERPRQHGAERRAADQGREAQHLGRRPTRREPHTF